MSEAQPASPPEGVEVEEVTELTCAVRTNGVNTIVVPDPCIAYIRLLVVDFFEEPIADVEYRIFDQEGEELFAGQISSEGEINHDDIDLGDYTLVLGGFVGEVAAVALEDERCTVFLPELGYIRLMIVGPAESPMADARYAIESDGVELFVGNADGEGLISCDLVPLHDYELIIGPKPIVVAAVAHQDEVVSVFLKAVSDETNTSSSQPTE